MKNLPVPPDISWTLIAASPDMIDTAFCGKLFPSAWRSSLALSVYEPEERPEALCGQRLTYLKVTCSITGYQPSEEETDQIVAAFPEQLTDDQRAARDGILSQHFACYGAIVNVGVFPGPRKIWKAVTVDCAALPDARPGAEISNPLEIAGVTFIAEGVSAHRFVDNFPPGGDGRAELHLHHTLVVTFSPGRNVGKVQAQVVHSSEAGVTMEAFRSGQSLGSRWSGHDQNTIQTLVIDEDRIDKVIFTAPHHQASLLEFRYEIAAGDTTDTKGIPPDDFPRIIDCHAHVQHSPETVPGDQRAGRSGARIKTLQAGMNRAVCQVLGQPAVSPPSDSGSFLDVLQNIDGTHEFVVLVSRPANMDGLCIETWLETGNFPEATVISRSSLDYDESFEDFPVTETAAGGFFSGGCKTIDAEYTVGSGWIVDRRPERGHDPGHPGLKIVEERSNDAASASLHDESYVPTSDTTVSVKGTICGRRSPFAAGASFDRTYRVFTRSEGPKPDHEQPTTDVQRLLITALDLCVCFRSKGRCPEVAIRPARRIPRPDRGIVDEPFIKMNKALLTAEGNASRRASAATALLRQVEQIMSNSWRMPTRYPLGQVGFLDTDFFKERIQPLVPQGVLQRTVASLPDLPKLVRAFGERATVADILDLNLGQLARRAGITVEQAGDLRQRLLRIHVDHRRDEERTRDPS